MDSRAKGIAQQSLKIEPVGPRADDAVRAVFPEKGDYDTWYVIPGLTAADLKSKQPNGNGSDNQEWTGAGHGKTFEIRVSRRQRAVSYILWDTTSKRTYLLEIATDERITKDMAVAFLTEQGENAVKDGVDKEMMKANKALWLAKVATGDAVRTKPAGANAKKAVAQTKSTPMAKRKAAAQAKAAAEKKKAAKTKAKAKAKAKAKPNSKRPAAAKAEGRDDDRDDVGDEDEEDEDDEEEEEEEEEDEESALQAVADADCRIPQPSAIPELASDAFAS